MKVSVLKPIFHGELGAFRRGSVVDMPEPWASRYIKMGAVERIAVAEKRAIPLAAAGVAAPSSALPADPASPPTTLKLSKRGGRRRKTVEASS